MKFFLHLRDSFCSLVAMFSFVFSCNVHFFLVSVFVGFPRSYVCPNSEMREVFGDGRGGQKARV